MLGITPYTTDWEVAAAPRRKKNLLYMYFGEGET
jgi:hypothetical protein